MKRNEALMIRPDGIETIRASGPAFTLEELWKAVGGYLETVSIPEPGWKELVLLVDEDGIMHKAPFNAYATQLAGRRIVGTAILIRRAGL